MRLWSEQLERREAVRRPTRLPCAVWIGSHRYDGVLQQVSADAVVVQMKPVPPASHEATVTFSTSSGVNFALRAVPVMGHAVPRSLRGLLAPSVVLSVREPTDAYLRWLDAPALGTA